MRARGDPLGQEKGGETEYRRQGKQVGSYCSNSITLEWGFLNSIVLGENNRTNLSSSNRKKQ